MPELDVLPIAVATVVMFVLSGVYHFVPGGQFAAAGPTAARFEMRLSMEPVDLPRRPRGNRPPTTRC
jgi:hypothetical protein